MTITITGVHSSSDIEAITKSVMSMAETMTVTNARDTTTSEAVVITGSMMAPT